MQHPRWLHPLCMFGCLAALATTPAMAETKQVQEVRSDLEQTMEAMKAAEAQEKELAAKQGKIQQELLGIQQDLVGMANSVKDQENALTQLEASRSKLEKEENAAEKTLTSRQKELALLLRGMMKLSYVPPELVIALPGDFNHMLRTAKILGLTSESIRIQAEEIRGQLQEIHGLQVMIEENQIQISKRKQALENQLATLESKLGERSSLHEQLISEHASSEKELASLSQKSGNLRDLLVELETTRRKNAEKAAHLAVTPKEKPSASKPSPTTGAAFANAKGRISLPADGKISSFYGDKTPDGDQSKGIRIATRSNAQVTSPFEGEVVYTGTFLNYGNMVIIRHGESFHTLMAGLKKITSAAGQHVLQGEPVGEMGNKDDQTSLYVEIRENNRPVDPMPWLASRQEAKHQRMR